MVLSRSRKSRNGCKWKFLWFLDQVTPFGMASYRELDRLCCCEQFVHVLCIGTGRFARQDSFSVCFLGGCFWLQLLFAFSRDRQEKWRREGYHFEMWFYTFSISGLDQIAGIPEEVGLPFVSQPEFWFFFGGKDRYLSSLLWFSSFRPRYGGMWL